jgi:hypothetical protein
MGHAAVMGMNESSARLARALRVRGVSVRPLVLVAIGALVAAACSASSSSVEGAGACMYPVIQTDSDSSDARCTAGPSGQSCEVSNGATVLADGGVENGTETCHPLCGPGKFELSCQSAGMFGPIPAPVSSLGCQIIPEPTPSNSLFYCCPCAN